MTDAISDTINKICEKYPEAEPHRKKLRDALAHVATVLPESLPMETYLEGVLAQLQQMPALHGKKDEEPGNTESRGSSGPQGA
jgi:hypothetical protein